MAQKQIYFKLAFKCLLLGAGLFLFKAGFAWPAAWLYLGLFTAWSFANAALLAKYRPQLLEARLETTPAPAGRADKLLSAGMGELYAAAIIISAIAPGWKPWPAWTAARWAAFAVIAACYAISSWAMLSNPYAVKQVAVQPGQSPVNTGPYAVVRHPLYAAFALHCLALPAALGSMLAFLPAAAAAACALGRAAYEDAFLRRELGGYAAYAQSVKYRAIPRLW